MLRNCRALRQGTEDYNFVAAHYEIFSPRAGGNLAFFRIRCDGAAPRRAHTDKSHDPGRATIYYHAEADRWYVFARNIPRGDHSEAECARLFLHYFGNDRRGAEITYVFTEREPCHGRGSRDCMGLLSRLLVTGGFGAYGENTPVRYVEPYMSREEAGMAARIALSDRKSVNDDNRREARRGTKRLRTEHKRGP